MEISKTQKRALCNYFGRFWSIHWEVQQTLNLQNEAKIQQK